MPTIYTKDECDEARSVLWARVDEVKKEISESITILTKAWHETLNAIVARVEAIEQKLAAGDAARETIKHQNQSHYQAFKEVKT